MAEIISDASTANIKLVASTFHYALDASVDGNITSTSANTEEPSPFKPTADFWAIIVTSSIISLLIALENTVVTTALPFIAAELDLQANYVWVTSAFFLTGYDHP